MAKRICYEATIQVEFEPTWEIDGDDDIWEAAGGMSDSICLLVQDQDPSVRYINILDYSECYTAE